MNKLPSTLFQRWFHSHEESGAVFRNAAFPIPRSRAPRPAIEIDSDGKARWMIGGPDDRLVPIEGSWSQSGDDTIKFDFESDRVGLQSARLVEDDRGPKLECTRKL